MTGLLSGPGGAQTGTDEAAFASRPPTDEVIYFVLPDRFADGDPANNTGGYEGGPDDHGYDPTHKGFYHGGDFQGLIDKLDYLQGLGVTALWVAPIFKNRPVQGPPDNRTAGYHGYWITDFTTTDPHFGRPADYRALVAAAHARDMKVYMDIVTNHTADVIQYRECSDCAYRSKRDYPYTTRGGPHGPVINPGFAGDGPAHQTAANFARLTDPRYAYTPFVPAGERALKVPAWLNDPILYHNRGQTTFEGENALYGDFFGLDDLFTENPRVVRGMIEIYRDWIDRFGVDGFRIDTARHVNDSFWRGFLPAMTDAATARGRPRFYIFGEVYVFDPQRLSHFTRNAGFDTVLDFAFQRTAQRVIAEDGPTRMLADLFARDDYYIAANRDSRHLPTFLGNHDMGRFARFVLDAQSDAAPDETVLARLELAHALMMFARGVPVIYYGDEQGFTGDGNDMDARADMFASRTEVYRDNRLIGTTATPAADNFDTRAPLYRAIGRMADVYRRHRILRDGHQWTRYAADGPGLFAFSRLRWASRRELLVVINTATEARDAEMPVDSAGPWTRLAGHGAANVRQAPKTVHVTVPGLSYALFAPSAPMTAASGALSAQFADAANASDASDFIGLSVTAPGPVRVRFFAQLADGSRRPLGTDLTAPYRLPVSARLRELARTGARLVAEVEDMQGRRVEAARALAGL